jgi:hypothetical protein
LKKTLLIIGFVLIGSFKLVGQDTIHACSWFQLPFPLIDMNERDTVNKYFHFDTAQTNNIWQLGTPSKFLFDSAYSIPLALVTDTLFTYPDNNTSSFTLVVHTGECNIGGLGFAHRSDTDSLLDGCVLEYSLDSGSTWHNVVNSTFNLNNFLAAPVASNGNKPGLTGTYDWTHSWIEGPVPYEGIIEYKFSFTSDSINTNKDGWMIDNLLAQNVYAGINEQVERSLFRIFPNPTSDFISIQTKIQDDLVITITNIFGQAILTTDQKRIDLSNLVTGIYFLKITTDKGEFDAKVLRR